MMSDVQKGSDNGYFVVGYGPMDDIHREFHDMLAALEQPGDEGEKLLVLHECLLRHCAQEERWMRASNFPSRAAHEREHETILEVVAEVRRRFDAGDMEIVTRLAQELPQWFEEHANTMDSALAVHLREFEASNAGPMIAGRPSTASAATA